MSKVCEKCGATISEAALFCSACGTRIGNVPEDTPYTGNLGDSTERTPQDAISSPPLQVAVVAPKSSRNAVLWALLLLVGTGLGYLILKDMRRDAQLTAQHKLQKQQRQLQEQRRRDVHWYANNSYADIVEQAYGGGRSVDWTVKNWTYNDIKGEYLIDLYPSWTGAATDSFYAAEGSLRVQLTKDSWTWTWESSWHNGNLVAYLDNMQNARQAALGIALFAGMMNALAN